MPRVVSSFQDLLYYPGSKEGHIPTQSASEGSGAFPSLRVGLICSSMRNFLAGVIATQVLQGQRLRSDYARYARVR